MRGKRKGKKRVASWCGGGHVKARGVGGFEPSDGDRTARGGWEEGFRLGGRFFSLFSPLVFWVCLELDATELFLLFRRVISLP